MAKSTDETVRIAAMKRATALVTEAIDVLDAHLSIPEAAAHLEVAQQRLREELAKHG